MSQTSNAALEGLEPIERASPEADLWPDTRPVPRLEVEGETCHVRRIAPARPKWSQFLAILGPGLIAASAGNDAGGIATYSSAGAEYGYRLIWVMMLITLPMGLVQEMCARLGAATGRGLLDLIREKFGWNWSLFAIAVVLLANAGLAVSEFVGMGEAAEVLGVSKLAAVPVAALTLWALVLFWSYSRLEKVLLALTLVFLVYPLAAWIGHPDPGQLAQGAFLPHIERNRAFITLLVALIGTTITPYMQVFQQSSVVEQASSRGSYGKERIDAWAGCILSNLMSISMIVATAATLHATGKTHLEKASDAARALEPVLGAAAGKLFALGLFGATTLAAAVLALSTAYAVTEALGLPKGVSLDFRRAPLFFGLFTGLLVLGAGVALLPRLPVMPLLVGVQVLNGVLLPFVLVFILLLADDHRLMGKLRNSRFQNGLGWLTVIVVTSAILILFGSQLMAG